MFRKMRRQIKIPWFALPLFVIFTISGTFLLKRNQRTHQQQYSKTTPATVGPSFSLAPLKHVTKSLAELGPMDELNPYVLFFNRVPKCGSEMLVLLLQWLQGWNNFKHVRLKGGNKRKLNRVEQEELVYEVTNVIRHHAVPLTFDRHLHFVNFTSFDRQSPTFINLIRDPVEKLISRYYYARVTKTMSTKTLEECLAKRHSECTFKNERPYDLSIPYFCGQDARCMLLNDKWALKTAKANVERYYPVVGVLDELNTTLEVLEHKLPYFFKGVHKLYYRDLLQPHRNKNRKKPKVKPTIEKYFRNKLVTEYEFYEWIKRRLFSQLQMLSGDHSSH